MRLKEKQTSGKMHQVWFPTAPSSDHGHYCLIIAEACCRGMVPSSSPNGNRYQDGYQFLSCNRPRPGLVLWLGISW